MYENDEETSDIEDLGGDEESQIITDGLEKLKIGYSQKEIQLAKKLWEGRVTAPRTFSLSQRHAPPWQGYIPTSEDLMLSESGCFLALDVETTGLPRRLCGFGSYYHYTELEGYDSSRVVQLGCAFFDKNGNLMESVEWIMKPQDFIISEEATSIHGISMEEALAKGVTWKEIVDELRRLFVRAGRIVMHNAPFDRHVLASELYRNGYGGLASIFFDKNWTCTMMQGTPIMKLPCPWGSGWKSPKLSELYQYLYGKSFDGQHTALADAVAAGYCFKALMDFGKN